MTFTAIYIVLALIIGLLIIFFIRYYSLKKLYTRPPSPDSEKTNPPKSDFDGFVRRFQEMLRIPTISWTDETKIDNTQFSKFQALLVDLYPKVHKSLERTVVGDFALIYRWRGKSADKKPVLLMAHYDVVAAEDTETEKWQVPPFSGEIRDGAVWGRGTLDDKVIIAFCMEVVETYLGQGWRPDRDIYFAFGGDEEISSRNGAMKIASILKKQGLEFEFVLDEGGIIAQDHMAFLKGQPVATVGLAEKGYVTFKLTATGKSGHSSMPDKKGTAIGTLARAITRLEKRSFPSRLDPILRNMLERFVPHVSIGLGIVFANLWLFSPLIRYIFSKGKVTDALIRTTQAITVFQSGEQENVLPGEALALINNRILPGWTIEDVRQRYTKLLNSSKVTIEEAANSLPNDPIQPKIINGTGFQLIESVLAETHPTAITAPYMMVGATDSKYFHDLTDQILRLIPLVLNPEELAYIHGVNERVSLENLEKGLAFYFHLINRL